MPEPWVSGKRPIETVAPAAAEQPPPPPPPALRHGASSRAAHPRGRKTRQQQSGQQEGLPQPGGSSNNAFMGREHTPGPAPEWGAGLGNTPVHPTRGEAPHLPSLLHEPEPPPSTLDRQTGEGWQRAAAAPDLPGAWAGWCKETSELEGGVHLLQEGWSLSGKVRGTHCCAAEAWVGASKGHCHEIKG